MSNYHQRIFVLNYSQDNLPSFNTQAEIDAWHQSLGRMLAYGLIRNAETDMVDMVIGNLGNLPLEVCAAYHAPLEQQPVKYDDGTRRYLDSPAEDISNFMVSLRDRAMKKHRPFVTAAVLHSDGKWSFHS